VHSLHRLQGGRRTNRKRMHHQRAHPRKIPGFGQKNGKFSKGFTVEYIDRNKNTEADEHAKVVARNTPLPADVFLQIILDALIKTIETEPRVINIIEGEDC
jgi:hypothetical protein